MIVFYPFFFVFIFLLVDRSHIFFSSGQMKRHLVVYSDEPGMLRFADVCYFTCVIKVGIVVCLPWFACLVL